MSREAAIIRAQAAFEANTIPWDKDLATLPESTLVALADCWERRAKDEEIDEIAYRDKIEQPKVQKMLGQVKRDIIAATTRTGERAFQASQRQYHGDGYPA